MSSLRRCSSGSGSPCCSTLFCNSGPGRRTEKESPGTPASAQLQYEVIAACQSRCLHPEGGIQSLWTHLTLAFKEQTVAPFNVKCRCVQMYTTDRHLLTLAVSTPPHTENWFSLLSLTNARTAAARVGGGRSRMEALLEALRARLSARLPKIAPLAKPNATQLRKRPPEAQASLYVHWPYCEKRCSYCNFNKYIPRNLDELRMKKCLIEEAQTLIRLSEVQRITSVYFGGGTPSLASPLTIAAILDTVSQSAHLAEGTEVTLEANPASADALCLSEFQKAGVNRLSIGIQSLDDAELKLLGRNHTACDALRTLEEAKKLFPGRISIDLIFGLPGQTVASWIQSLEKMLAVCDDHISFYQLTLERGTSLFKQVHQGFLPRINVDTVSEMYERARHVLQNSGFHQYEVSNFSRNGAFSTHNLSYWQGSQYIGIGPGAHGRFVPWGDGKTHREARIQTLEPDIWMKEVLAFGHGTRKQTPLRELDILEEVLMLGLRLDVGITHQHWLQFAPNLSLWDVFGEAEEVRELEEHGLVFLDHRGLRCSWKGLAVLDALLLTLLKQLQQAWMERETFSGM